MVRYGIAILHKRIDSSRLWFIYVLRNRDSSSLSNSKHHRPPYFLQRKKKNCCFKPAPGRQGSSCRGRGRRRRWLRRTKCSRLDVICAKPLDTNGRSMRRKMFFFVCVLNCLFKFTPLPLTACFAPLFSAISIPRHVRHHHQSKYDWHNTLLICSSPVAI
jgi:hypothetical protein